MVHLPEGPESSNEQWFLLWFCKGPYLQETVPFLEAIWHRFLVNPYVGMQTGALLVRTSYPNANVSTGTRQVSGRILLHLGELKSLFWIPVTLGWQSGPSRSSPRWATHWLWDLRGITHNPRLREELSSWTTPAGCGIWGWSLSPWQHRASYRAGNL